MFEINLKIKKYNENTLKKCEIKTTSRWQQVSVNKRVIAIEPNQFKRLIWLIMLSRDAEQCCGCVWIIFAEEKTGNMLSKRSLLINALLIELL